MISTTELINFKLQASRSKSGERREFPTQITLPPNQYSLPSLDIIDFKLTRESKITSSTFRVTAEPASLPNRFSHQLSTAPTVNYHSLDSTNMDVSKLQFNIRSKIFSPPRLQLSDNLTEGPRYKNLVSDFSAPFSPSFSLNSKPVPQALCLHSNTNLDSMSSLPDFKSIADNTFNGPQSSLAQNVDSVESAENQSSFKGKLFQTLEDLLLPAVANAKEISICERPQYDSALHEFNQVDGYGNAKEIAKIGGRVSDNINTGSFKNFCAIRAAISLFNAPQLQNNSKCKIPKIKGETVTGGDGLQYIYRISTLTKFLTEKWGVPDYDSRIKNLQKPKEFHGVIIHLMPEGVAASFTGHFEITDKTPYIGEYIYWALPKSEKYFSPSPSAHIP